MLKEINLEKAYKRTAIFANIIIGIQCLGLIIAIYSYNSNVNFNNAQLHAMERYEKTKNSIAAVDRVYDPLFLKYYSLLDEKSNIRNNMDCEAYYYVLNAYYSISVVYMNNIANKEIIKELIGEGVKYFISLPIYDGNNDKEVLSAKREIKKMVDDF